MSETENDTPAPEPETAQEPTGATESDAEAEETEEPEDEDEDAEEPGDEQLRQQEQKAKAELLSELKDQDKKLENEAERHRKRVVEIMGDGAEQLYQCPLCHPNIPGWRYNVLPDPDVLALVKQAIGEPAQPPYKPDHYSKVCDVCDGFGGVLTGSKVQSQALLPCIKCGANGWLPIGPERQGAQALPMNGPTPPVSYQLPSLNTPDPPEVEALKQLGYIVVAPIPAPESVQT